MSGSMDEIVNDAEAENDAEAFEEWAREVCDECGIELDD